MFETGAYIVCGQHGVCRVESIGPIRLAEASAGRDYYTLSPLYSKGGVVYVPADSEKIIMRYVISRQEAEQLIGEIDGMDMIPIDNERQREETLKSAENLRHEAVGAGDQDHQCPQGKETGPGEKSDRR